MNRPDAAPRGDTLRAFSVLAFATVLLHAAVFPATARIDGAGTATFVTLVHLVYCSLFTAAAMAVPAILHAVLPRSRAGGAAVAASAVVLLASLHAAIAADAAVHRTFGYHVNGLVWNVVVTPGGIESLGADAATQATAAALGAAVLVACAGLWVLAARSERLRGAVARRATRRRVLAACAVLVAAHAADRVTYGLCYAAGHEPVLSAAEAYPVYFRSRLLSFARMLGIEAPRTEDGAPSLRASGSDEDAALAYPLHPLRRADGAPQPDILWLVAESLRSDMLDAEVMPRTLEFARGGRRFLRHYSSGNGTRMALFGMFYGLYGANWFPFLHASRGPVLVDALLDAGYEFDVRTSARFSFPEFDRTIWRRVPASRMHEGDPGLAGWQNDRRHVDALTAALRAPAGPRPEFCFLFFESPHAPYRYPADAEIRPDAAKRVNYVTMDTSDPAEVAAVRNRYVNACHHLDIQLGRIYDALAESGRLGRTLVIVTGDHGEEFMERGRWGHHSGFCDQQTRTPLVIRGPGIAPGEETSITSHVDLPATVLARIGVTNPPRDYSLGFDVLGGRRDAPAVAAGWDDLCLIDDGAKIVLPFRGGDRRADAITRGDDEPMTAAESRAARNARTPAIVSILRDLTRFTR